MSTKPHSNELQLNSMMDIAIQRAESAKTPVDRERARFHTGKLMAEQVYLIPEERRLAWLQRGQQACINSVFQEEGTNFAEGINDLAATTVVPWILERLPAKDVATWVRGTRDVLLERAGEAVDKGVKVTHMTEKAKYLTESREVQKKMPAKDRMAFVTTWRDRYIDLTERYHAGQGTLAHMPLDYVSYAVINNQDAVLHLTPENRAKYVNGGIKRMLDVTAREEQKENGRPKEWYIATRRIIRLSHVTPSLSERTLKKAGYQTLKSDDNAELQNQVEVLKKSLGDNILDVTRPLKRAKYEAMVTKKAKAIAKKFPHLMIGLNVDNPDAIEQTTNKIRVMQANYNMMLGAQEYFQSQKLDANPFIALTVG